MKKGGIPALTNQEQVLPTTYVRLGQLESTGLPTGSLARGGGGGGVALGYFLSGYVPPGTPNWHPVLKKISP